LYTQVLILLSDCPHGIPVQHDPEPHQYVANDLLSYTRRQKCDIEATFMAAVQEIFVQVCDHCRLVVWEYSEKGRMEK
jgi:hypothetical protein